MTRFDVLTLGEHLNKKGVEIAIRSFADFYHTQTPKNQRLTTFHYVLPQSGWKEAKATISKMIANHEISECVSIYEPADQKKIAEIQESASLLMLPVEENTGMAIPHSFSNGVPVLCFERDGIQDFMDSSCGITVRNRSLEQAVQDFSNMLDILHHDPEVREVLRKGAISRYQNYARLGSQISVIHRQTVHQRAEKIGD